MAADRPINADVPEREEPEQGAGAGAGGAGAAGGPGGAGAAGPAGGPGGAGAPGGARSGPEPTKRTHLSPHSGDGGAGGAAPATPRQAAAPPPAPPSRRRRPRIPGPLLLVGGLVALAVLFIALAVLAGSGGGSEDEESPRGPAPAPLVVTGEAPQEEDPAAPEGGTPEGLGYPAFATANTTRVGGATAAENAAAVALAAFPATTPEQRPAAVALVAEDEWPAAIAAAVLMAPPVRVPLLFSGPDSTPEATEEALAALAPQGSAETGGARGFAFGAALVPDSLVGIETIRGGGAGAGEAPAATAAAAIAELRDRLFDAPPAAIVLGAAGRARLRRPGGRLGRPLGDPVLFAAADALPKATAAALRRHSEAPVYVLGPAAAISNSVLAAVKKLGNPVRRVAGADPVRNAVAFARFAADDGFGWNVNDPGHGFVLARAGEPLAAAAAAPLSAAGTWGPLLLSDGAGSLPPEVRDYLLDVKPGYTTNPTRAYYNHVWVIGDQEAIDVKQQAEANELAALAKIGEG